MYKLVKISHAGKRIGLSYDDTPEELIEAGERLLSKFPDESYGVINENGVIVWPARAS